MTEKEKHATILPDGTSSARREPQPALTAESMSPPTPTISVVNQPTATTTATTAANVPPPASSQSSRMRRRQQQQQQHVHHHRHYSKGYLAWRRVMSLFSGCVYHFTGYNFEKTKKTKTDGAGENNLELDAWEGPDAGRPDNEVITAKYTLITFLPYSFFGQFRYLSNLYFLVIFILAQIGASSALNWYQTPIEPSGFMEALLVVVIVTMIFEGWYDLGRHREDRRVNSRRARRLNPTTKQVEEVTWKSLRAGDIVYCRREESFPADLLFLAARQRECDPSAPRASPPPNGATTTAAEDADFDWNQCYVETSNIDGETNLKVRFTPNKFVRDPVEVGREGSDEGKWLDALRGWTLIYDLPKAQLEFSGTAEYEKEDDVLPGMSVREEEDVELGKEAVPLDFGNVLLRGSILKNTNEIVGLVIYAGEETKAVQSSSETKNKVSNVILLTNKIIITILCFGLVLVVASAAVASTFFPTMNSTWYLIASDPKSGVYYVFGPFWSSFFTYVILYSSLLPISLIIAVTITNVAQAVFVNFDIEMYDESKDRPAKCATLELTQEIGQISFLFSDKTGTLTRNEMKLVGAEVAGTLYGVVSERGGGLADSAPFSNAANPTSTNPDTPGSISFPSSPQHQGNASPITSDMPLPTIFADLIEAARDANSAPHTAEACREFIAALAVCHTVLVDGVGDKMKYNAEGPDEEALVFAAANFGYKLMSTKRGKVTIECDFPLPRRHTEPSTTGHHGVSADGEKTRGVYEILAVNRFDSTRKRMSVVVRLPNGKIELIAKGADSVMFERLAPFGRPPESSTEPSSASTEASSSLSAGETLRARAKFGANLDRFAAKGLRTLVLCRRSISQEEFAVWGRSYLAASNALGKDRSAMLDACGEEIERGFEILGATAIEDRLQDEVPETLRAFREAGIRTWVLTGDKVETAINIGFSSGLLIPEMKIVEITSSDAAENLASLRLLSSQLDPVSLLKAQKAMEAAKRGRHHKHRTSKGTETKKSSSAFSNSAPASPAHSRSTSEVALGQHPTNSNSMTLHDDQMGADHRQSLLSPRSRLSLNLSFATKKDNRVSLEMGAGETTGEDPFGMVNAVKRGANTVLLNPFSQLIHAASHVNHPHLPHSLHTSSSSNSNSTTMMVNPDQYKRKRAASAGAAVGGGGGDDVNETDPDLKSAPSSAMGSRSSSFILRRPKALLSPSSHNNATSPDSSSVPVPVIIASVSPPDTPHPPAPGETRTPPPIVSSETVNVALASRVHHNNELAERQRPEGAGGSSSISLNPAGGAMGSSQATVDDSEGAEEEFVNRVREMGAEAKNLALVVSGQALDSLLYDPVAAAQKRLRGGGTGKSASEMASEIEGEMAKEAKRTTITESEAVFLSVAKLCRVVVACRVSPRQKALLVRLVRRGVLIAGREPITLAVGDGANDVAMIQEARVGVGIAGREGSQAANAADFSIGQFRFLKRLLLVHGRWNYRRMAMVILFIFYSHILPVMCSFAYNFYNLWSGTFPFFVQWLVAYSYLIVIPCLIAAMFNRDISAETAMSFPSMYISGRANLHLGEFKMAEYVLKSFLHSAVICGMNLAVLAPPTVSFSDIGTTMYFCVLTVALSRLALEIFSWTAVTTFFYLFFLFSFWWLEPLVGSTTSTINTLYGDTVLWGPDSSAYAWSSMSVVVAITLTLDLTLSLMRRQFFPNLVDVVIEIDRGYSGDKKRDLLTANDLIRTLGKPLALPIGAVTRAVNATRNVVTLAPKSRSAYAYEVPENPQNTEGTESAGNMQPGLTPRNRRRIVSISALTSLLGGGGSVGSLSRKASKEENTLLHSKSSSPKSAGSLTSSSHVVGMKKTSSSTATFGEGGRVSATPSPPIVPSISASNPNAKPPTRVRIVMSATDSQRNVYVSTKALDDVEGEEEEEFRDGRV